MRARGVLACVQLALLRAGELVEHREAADRLGRWGGELMEMREQMLAVLAGRPRARWLRSREWDVEGTYRILLALVQDTCAPS